MTEGTHEYSIYRHRRHIYQICPDGKRRSDSLQRKDPHSAEGRRELVEAIGRLYDEMPDVEGIAISMPGIIDSENGYCVMGGALGYNDDFYFRHVLYSDCPYMIPRAEIVTCKFQNDANLYGALQCYLENA